MKIIKITACLLLAILMSACAVGSSNGSNDSIDSIGYSEDELGQDYSPSPTKTGALIMAQRFIRQEFASNAEFEEEGTIVEETNVPGRFKVLQRFTAEDHPSNWSKFVYRIWVQRFDDGTWEFGNLGVENIDGERILTTNGNMKEREQNDGVGDELTVAGIKFKIAEKNPDAIRIYTPKKLSRSQLRSVTKELMNQYGTIQFATDAKHERGEEYAFFNGLTFIDFDTDEIMDGKKFLNN